MCASAQQKLHLLKSGKVSLPRAFQMWHWTAVKDRDRAAKPRKCWLNGLSCMKSLAHMRGVKGRNLCKVYSQPSVENIYILVENYRFTYIGYIKKKKKAWTQQRISELTLNNLWISFYSQLIQSLLLYLLESNLSKKAQQPFLSPASAPTVIREGSNRS